MEIGFISRVLMFFSSYSLLFFALYYKYKTNIFIFMLIVSLIGLLILIFAINSKANPDEAKVENIQIKNEQVSSYIVTYILPFLSFDLKNTGDQLSLLVIFIIICILYIKSDMLYINPMLMLLGYNIYDITLDNNKKRILISRKSLNEIKLLEDIHFYELLDRTIIKER